MQQLDAKSTRLVQWYPGHIAKAERRLKEQMRMVDVVLEVRDARIPRATCHKQIPEWCGDKPRLLVMNRVDSISDLDKTAWSQELRCQKQPFFWTNSKLGTGIPQLSKAASQISSSINSRRTARGLQPRPVRACVIGFPNVGKSALINRLINRRACPSAPKPGVTRDLKWVRVGGALDLLDAPGVIPMSFGDQRAAELLAICNDIGEAAYLDSQVAAQLLEIIRRLPCKESVLLQVASRYGFDFHEDMSGEDFVAQLTEERSLSDSERAGQQILNDYRAGALGALALEVPKAL